MYACTLQGTNRPPRINVLVDDNNLGPVRTAATHRLIRVPRVGAVCMSQAPHPQDQGLCSATANGWQECLVTNEWPEGLHPAGKREPC